MTIAVGLKYKGGYFLCADTLVTVPGAYKMGQSKIRNIQTNSCRAFFAIAGNLDFTDRALEIIKFYLDSAEPDRNQVRNVLDAACLEIHKKYEEASWMDPNLYLNLQMIALVTIHDQPTEFLKISGPIVSPAEQYTCIGSGELLARFLLTRIFSSSSLDKATAMRAAVYVLLNVKQFVDGCGGQTQFVSVSDNGGWHYPPHDDLSFEYIAELEKTLATTDRQINRIWPKLLDQSLKAEAFSDFMEKNHKFICDLRKKYFEKLEDRFQSYLESQLEQAEQNLESEKEE